MDEDLKLYIPMGVKPEAELFNGLGRKQLCQSIMGPLGCGRRRRRCRSGLPGNVTTTVILVHGRILG